MTDTLAPRPVPSFAELFTPKLVTVLREGYGRQAFMADLAAGLTVAIVALPLSMAIAIASGVTPEKGLVTAIVGGFLVSALGGSRFQIGGPAGAFIVLVAATVERHGVDGLILATGMSGLMLAAIGFLRLGTFIKFIPYPVTVGFTSGIAVIILASQIVPALGLGLAGPEPGPIAAKLPVLWDALPTVTPAAVAITAGTVATILGLKRFAPKVPGMLVAVAGASFAAAAFGLPVETIGTRFGGMPSGLPMPALPEITGERVVAVLPDAIAFTLLGAIESLLSAVVADSMTGRRHRSNCELVAQGAANLGSAVFGGFCVTGTIARTATNVRAGARGPVSGMVHAGALLLFVVFLAPMADAIPLAALAGVLVVVSWTMFERHAFAALMAGNRGDALVLLATFGLTVFRDLTEAIVVGFALGSVLFIHRMSQVTAVESHAPFVAEDRPDRERGPGEEPMPVRADIVVHRVRGVLFFGAASIMESVLDRIGDEHRALVIDLAGTPFLDSSGAQAVAAIAVRAEKRGVRVYVTGTGAGARRELAAQGLRPPATIYRETVEAALADWGRVSRGR